MTRKICKGAPPDHHRFSGFFFWKTWTSFDNNLLIGIKYFCVFCFRIFQNGEFGCSRRGSWSNRTDSFPPVASGHRGKSIFVVNSGIWDADLCTIVERSYIKYVPLFMDWAQSLTTTGDVVVWRTTPPGSLGCRRRSQKLDYTNTIALPLARQRGFLVFQSNLVERPWYQNLCHLHYSCPVKVSEYSWMMYGVVGEATTRYFFDWLIKVLQE